MGYFCGVQISRYQDKCHNHFDQNKSINMNSIGDIGEILCKYVEYNDLENVQKLLDQG